jgi:hypothetical protein
LTVRPTSFAALGARRSASIDIASRATGIQIHSSSLRNTSSPRSLKKRVAEIGETAMGRQGRKYLSLLNGEKKVTPQTAVGHRIQQSVTRGGQKEI